MERKALSPEDFAEIEAFAFKPLKIKGQSVMAEALTAEANRRFERVSADHILPWQTHLSRGKELRIKTYYGAAIKVEAGEPFDGAPRRVFWGVFMDEFLRGEMDSLLSWVDRQQSIYEFDRNAALDDAVALWSDAVVKLYCQMQVVDLRLRSPEAPYEALPYDLCFKTRSMLRDLEERFGDQAHYVEEEEHRFARKYGPAAAAAAFLVFLAPIVIVFG